MFTDFVAFVPCFSLQEVSLASEALQQHRAGMTATSEIPPGEKPSLDALHPPVSSLSDRIKKALDDDPPNDQRKLMLGILLQTAPGKWRSYEIMKAEFVKNGFEEGQAAAALRDISYQMRVGLPAADVAGHEKPIFVLAERSRVGGVIHYRLTEAGRIAAEAHLLS